MLQGQKDLLAVGRLILSELAPWFPLNRVFSTSWILPKRPLLEAARQLRLSRAQERGQSIQAGEGLVGQCALEKEKIVLTGVPRDYLAISSVWARATPLNIIVLPVVIPKGKSRR